MTGPDLSSQVIRGGCRLISLMAVRASSMTSAPCATTTFVTSSPRNDFISHDVYVSASDSGATTCTMVSSILRIAASSAAHTAAAVDDDEPSTPTRIRSMAHLYSSAWLARSTARDRLRDVLLRSALGRVLDERRRYAHRQHQRRLILGGQRLEQRNQAVVFGLLQLHPVCAPAGGDLHNRARPARMALTRVNRRSRL